MDFTVAHSARRYNYLLGGKDNFAVDRACGDAIAELFPTIRQAARENRKFLHRVVAHLTRLGIQQFVDIGCGFPTTATPNTHDIAQAINATVRVVYIDNYPAVLAHGRALTTSTVEGRIVHVHGDILDPDSILHNDALTQTLDLSQPVAILMLAVLHLIPDENNPAGIVRRLVEKMPSGSYLAMSHATFDVLPAHTIAKIQKLDGAGSWRPRTRDEFSQLFDGLDVIAPGIVPITQWHPHDEPRPAATAAQTATYGAVAQHAAPSVTRTASPTRRGGQDEYATADGSGTGRLVDAVTTPSGAAHGGGA